MKLKDELDKIKRKRDDEVSKLKVVIQEYEQKNELLSSELKKYRDGENNLTVSIGKVRKNLLKIIFSQI